MRKLTIVFFTFFVIPPYYAQDSTALVEFETHMSQATKYDELSFFAECVDEINAAIQIAKEQKWKEREVIASIFLAETKRKSEDYEEGLSVLYNLDDSRLFPSLHVKKLGRMAALFNQKANATNNSDYLRDSVLIYLNRAIKDAIDLNLKAELASLYNELGYTLGSTDVDSSLFYLKKAAHQFTELEDTANYVVAQTNILRTHAQMGNYDKAKLIIDELSALVSYGNWNALGVKLEFYRTLTFYYSEIGDSSKFTSWNVKKYKTKAEFLKNAGSSKLNSFRALYETKKYQNEAKENAQQLEIESKRRKELVAYFSVLLFFSLGIGILLFRERKLKKAVNKANEKYHMLLVESNHRIKNNLQMIISMLEYGSKDLKNKDSLAFKRMSGKIQTISALHKHLYLDVHNERVNLKTYFTEILTLYEELSSNFFTVSLSINNVKIESERIVYFGLILNEMLSNTFEHGNSQERNIKIEVEDREDRFRFSYTDGSHFEANHQKGTGLLLIEQLVKRVGGSNFKVDGSIGQYQFEFYV